MKVKTEVIALSLRTGVSAKEGTNKDRRYYSIQALDFGGDMFDFFNWDDGTVSGLLKDMAVPFVMECELSIGSKGDKPTVDLNRIFRVSPGFDLGSLVKNAKLPMQDFGASAASSSKKIDLKL